jgi:hypothetical protein
MEHGRGRGWGPFTGRQLTIVILALIAGVVAYPFAAAAANAVFTSNSAAVPAVAATNSNAKGIGVKGTGKQYGVFSNGPLGVATGNALACAGCVTSADLSQKAKKGKLIYEGYKAFRGPFTGAPPPTVATFTVPAGLMCATASASAFASAAPAPVEVIFERSSSPAVVPSAVVQVYATEAHSHKALVSDGTLCTTVPAGTYSYDAVAGSNETATDENDVGSITVQVYSP